MVRIDYRSGIPIYEQVVDGFEKLIFQEILPADTKLPSVRSLAMELAINPNTIQRAYAELENKKLIYPVRGKGNFVSGEFHMMREQKLQQIGKEISSLVDMARKYGATDEQLRKWILQESKKKEEGE